VEVPEDVRAERAIELSVGDLFDRWLMVLVRGIVFDSSPGRRWCCGLNGGFGFLEVERLVFGMRRFKGKATRRKKGSTPPLYSRPCR